jgi:DNA-binding NarL/FixJ family response regulator
VHSITVMRRILKCPISSELVDAYQEGLLAYLARPHEAALRRARELGRNAMAGGLSLSEMSVIHHESVRKILLRTLQVLQLIAEGNTTRVIAERLSLTVKTAESYRTGLMAKLDIHETAGLVRYAVRRGLVKP